MYRRRAIHYQRLYGLYLSRVVSARLPKADFFILLSCVSMKLGSIEVL